MWSPLKSKAPDEAGDRAQAPCQEAGPLPLPPARSVGAALALLGATPSS